MYTALKTKSQLTYGISLTNGADKPGTTGPRIPAARLRNGHGLLLYGSAAL